MTKSDPDSSRFCVAQWLAPDQELFEKWMAGRVHVMTGDEGELPLVLRRFANVVTADPALNLLFSEMFGQVPEEPPFHQDPAGGPRLLDFPHMLRLMARLLQQAPEFNETRMVGLPLHTMLNWAMGTKSGFFAFLHPEVNRCLKDILNEWGRFLKSPESRYVLTDDADIGWFSAAARKKMPDFERDFQCDDASPYHGFLSWDDFFTRRLKAGARPVAAPKDDLVVVNPCEAAPFKIARNVKPLDLFWIKSQPYSLHEMMAHNPLAEHFEGGTVYQAYLDAYNYHRWHSPVSGTIVEAFVTDGSYFSATLAVEPAESLSRHAQGYLAHVATRAILFIQADHPAIGLLCLVAIGMGEVSTCEITVAVGQHAEKGSQLGMFHFGGSTTCLVFRPEVDIEFDLNGVTPDVHAKKLLVNSLLANVVEH